MITLINAKENNLKSVNLNLPDHKLIVVTGVSGSGKSTLVYDVIFQEARRRYLETFSSHARQFMGRLNRPDIQYISGLSPAIALEQKQLTQSPRSTVGTLTELYDLLRLLFARLGKPENTFPKELVINRSLFSFNTPQGACPECRGLGMADAIDPELLLKDENKTIRQGAFAMTTPSGYIVYSQVTMAVLNQICEVEGFSVDIPWKELNEAQKKIVLFGSRKILVPFGKHPLESRMKWTGITAKPREESFYKGIVPVMEEILKRDRNPNVLRFAQTVSCPVCIGSRLKKEVNQITFHGKSITELSNSTINEMITFFESLDMEGHERLVGGPILDEIRKTGKLIQKLGLGFLTLSQPSQSLSGGETQRLRLAKMASSGLRGILYVFDEPSMGMHPTEISNLLEVLFSLRDQENTVLVVEHNPIVMKHADWIVDMGPGAGEQGGHFLFSGRASDFFNQQEYGSSQTLKHFHKTTDFKITQPSLNEVVVLSNAQINGTNKPTITFKTQALNIITGVSGSGKKLLVDRFQRLLTESNKRTESSFVIENGDLLKRVISIDQSPIGKTPRSNPATYIGLADELRDLFASIVEAKSKGFTKNHFSFNTQAGRCPKCEGAGYEQVGMQLLGTVELICSECNGKQFRPEILTVLYQGKNLSEIYSLSVDAALRFFENHPTISPFLTTLQQVGLGYLTLNQRSGTLSGGEARRVKLAKNLVKATKQPTLFIIDEPSSGLHDHDVEVLIENLNRLVNQKHTVVMVEQNPIVLKQADHLIELGPNGKNEGLNLIYQGVPSGILTVSNSETAKALQGILTEPISNPIPVFERFGPILLKDVSTHNLKNVDVSIPFNKLTVLTGVSGSGKSSLAFDTLFTEGRERYAESFSVYARNRLNLNSEAQFESIKGLMPTLAVNQKSISNSERSTVGTITDIYDTLRLLFARVGTRESGSETPLASWFSFNHEQGACKTCEGLGHRIVCDAEKLISNPEKPISAGAMDGSKPGKFYGDLHGQYIPTLLAAGTERSFDYSVPWNEISDEAKQLALFGSGSKIYHVTWEYKRNNRTGTHEFTGPWPGFLHLVIEEYLRKANDKRAEALLPVMKKEPCSVCGGLRLNERALKSKVLDNTIAEWTQMPVTDLAVWLKKNVVITHAFSKEPITQKAAQVMVGIVLNGIDMLLHLGLGYLSLNREAKTLSGGEGQRVRLASVLNQNLSGVCVVLDEPTRGLHPKDTENLIYILQELKRQGNTVVVCEHDPYFINSADHIIELGPGAGKYGGYVIAEGHSNELVNSFKSIIGAYLKEGYLYARKKRPISFIKAIQVKGALVNNLKNIDVRIPANALVVLGGVSGSGKSSLMQEVVYQSAVQQRPVNCRQITGLQLFDQIIFAGQKLPKLHAQSMVAGYLDLHPILENEFAMAAKAQNFSLTKAHFSLFSKTGSCESCEGNGELKTSMDFLADVYEPCETCHGTGFKPEVLAATIQGKNIADALALSFEELPLLFTSSKIKETCQLAVQLGLGYLSINQRLKTLSGGELQRLSLIHSLLENKGKACLFLLDEPTTGLHMLDVEHLMVAFDKLLDAGHSLLVIEHHQTVVSSADYLIELGPGAGELGGKVVRER